MNEASNNATPYRPHYPRHFFNICSNAQTGVALNINSEVVNYVRFADDIVLIPESVY